MYTIYDYLKYYKDYSLKDLKWNKMDNLFLACLSYMPLKSFGFKTYGEVVSDLLKIKNVDTKDLMVPKSLELIQIVKESKRYNNIKFFNFISRVDSKTQFGAFTVVLDNIRVISFRGTDASIIGWLENFRIAYSYPTYTQSLAINYLRENINFFDKNVYVIGHSKGGNLALVSAMELSNFKFNKIKEVINFDGPGLRFTEYKSNKFNRLKTKLINIVPTGSYIGTLLYNENYNVVKSNTYAIGEHYPTSWNMFGIEFIKGTLSKTSVNLIKRTTVNIKDLDNNKIKDIFESAFKVFDKRETKNMKITLGDIVSLIKTMSKMDLELSSYITTILKTMIVLSRE